MSKSVIGVLIGWCCAASCLAAAPFDNGLTDTEKRWLQGVWPVVAFARQSGLPLDIVVQPQPTSGQAPLALAFVEGRCKLVFSMRENPQADHVFASVEPGLLDPALELMAAHELGHCRRYLDGAWYRMPASFTRRAGRDSVTAPDSNLETASQRLEEGYGDLVGLAWTQQRHPQLYARLHAWLVGERSAERVRGSPHDTLAWLRLAEDGGVLRGPSIFASPEAVWASVADTNEGDERRNDAGE